MRDQVLIPTQTTGKIVYIFRFLDRKREENRFWTERLVSVSRI